jgi:ABC-2 type transport system ATP-binding protein
MNAITATNVGHRAASGWSAAKPAFKRLEATQFKGRWVLRRCSFAVPPGRVVGLVGPNGAGKTTLLRVLAGLLRPTEGEVRLNGRDPAAPEGLPTVAFLAQSKPLYPRFTVDDTLRFCRELNPRFDEPFARDRLRRLDIPATQRVGRLSGGQRAQVALTLALAKRAELILLDEPMADLDPLGRNDVMRDLMAATAEYGLTVVLSSHVLADLEDSCDHLVMVQQGRVQLAGDVDDLRTAHLAVDGLREHAAALAPHTVVQEGGSGRQATALLRLDGSFTDPRWATRAPSLEEIVLAYLRNPDAAALPALELVTS